jgi:two-component system phosphate regulon response regulator PhoB
LVEASSLARRTVLVVEDEAGILGFVSDFLRDEGYDVVGWPRGTEALQTAREARPELIILDLGLPGKSGREVLRELRSDPQTRAIPVVLTSATLEQAGQDLRLADATLPKPFELGSLLAVVSRFVAGAGRAEPTCLAAAPGLA